VLAGRLRILLIAAVALIGAGTLAACGNKEKIVTSADTEGPYVDVGPLQYQVQISRQLNPTDEEDRGYFTGVQGADKLGPEETWFAVFVKVLNRDDTDHLSAKDFEIEDTVGRRYSPVAVGGDNAFAYRAGTVTSGGTLPATDSTANQSSIGGSMLLFRLTLDSLANRPLVLRIKSPGKPPEAEIDLDV